jgi:hypothetical protein
MNRTPDSASRRASRHWRPKFSVIGSSMPYSALRGVALALDVERFRSFGLHAERQLVGRDARLEHRIVVTARGVFGVELAQQVELRPLELGRDVAGARGDGSSPPSRERWRCRSACLDRRRARTRSTSLLTPPWPSVGQIVMNPGRLSFSLPRP